MGDFLVAGSLLFEIRKGYMKKIVSIFIFAAVCGGLHTASAQQAEPAARVEKVAVKTNLLYWATTTPNAGFEFGLGKKTTLDISGGYNPWTLDKGDNRKVRHFVVKPEFRYWLCERFQGHFFGVHAGYGEYNISAVHIPLVETSRDDRYQGWGAGVGISYGYSWILGRRWNLEATIGVGYVYFDYKRYDCVTCGPFRNAASKHYFGPTKLGISLIYMIK